MDYQAAQKAIQLDAELQEYIKANGGPMREPPSISAFRTFLQPIEAALAASPTPAGIHESFASIPVRDGTTISARIHRPAVTTTTTTTTTTSEESIPSPLILYFHLGGFSAGSSALTIPLCRTLVQHLHAVCLSIDYRLAPEHPFPTPIHDSWDALQWAASHAADLGASPARAGFIVGGESAGGNMSIVLAHLARDHALSPPLTGQFLSLPYCLPPNTVPEKYKQYYHSWAQSDEAPALFSRSIIDLTREAHRPDMRDPLFAALHHPAGHGGLPPAYFQVCALDPFRDEALVYEMVLREECGVRTRLDLYEGLPHAFWVMMPGLKASEKARRDQVDGFRWLLENKREAGL